MNIHIYSSVDQAKTLWKDIFEKSPQTSPFLSFEYAELFSSQFIDIKRSENVIISVDQNILTAYEIVKNKAILIGMKHVLGNQEVTDFGDILKLPSVVLNHTLPLIHAELKKRGVSSIQYDYIRTDSPLYSYMYSNGFMLQRQEVSPFVDLPTSWERYLDNLHRIERKELKRKLKRLETRQFSVRFSSPVTQLDFETFVRLHKLSDESKNKFMSNEMERFFQELTKLQIPNWVIKCVFLDIDSIPVSSIFYFESTDELLLYNSGFNPAYKQYSVGLLLGALLIKHAIETGKKRVDFLRGNERYKYDLGAKNLELFRTIITL